MALEIHVGLDLGSDTLKIAYAYDYKGVKTGKIVGDPESMTAIPAVAHYDFEDGRWRFGEEVDRIGDKSFMGVVKIKSLLTLLNGKCAPQVNESNQRAYFNGNDFPKFYFPERRKISSDFSKAVSRKMTFNVKGLTPAKICENFFAYAGALVEKRAALLAKKHGEKDFKIIPSLLHPQYTAKECVAELERLVTCGFGCAPLKVMSMTKALCAYAMKTNRIKNGESVLIFNMGEEQISVVKASLLKTGLAVDGADGHNDPEYIGGNDIDDAVAEYLEEEMSHRESMGRPSSGEEGHMAEGSLNSKQYLFVKDIKSAKIILGMPLYDRGVFKKGVPVGVLRDLYIQRNITRASFAKCIGITNGSGVAGRIADYIDREISRSINSDVSKVFLTGGPVETYGLVEFIQKKFKDRKVGIYTFENEDSSYEGLKNDGFNILSYEDALYAPALGCALSAINNMDIKTVLALSYGLRLFLFEGETPYFEFLVNKGDILPPEGAKFLIPKVGDRGITTTEGSISSAPMHIMSTVLTKSDVANRKFYPKIDYAKASDGNNYLRCDPQNKRCMDALVQYAGFRILNGGTQNGSGAGMIYYYYNKTRVRLIQKVFAMIGVSIDGEGRARPFAENDRTRNGKDVVTLEYLWDIRQNGRVIKHAGETDVVFKKDIVFDFDIDEMIFS